MECWTITQPIIKVLYIRLIIVCKFNHKCVIAKCRLTVISLPKSDACKGSDKEGTTLQEVSGFGHHQRQVHHVSTQPQKIDRRPQSCRTQHRSGSSGKHRTYTTSARFQPSFDQQQQESCPCQLSHRLQEGSFRSGYAHSS